MRIAVLNLTGGSYSWGYRRYIAEILPRIAAAPGVEAVLCAAPPALGVEAWFDPSPKIRFAACEPFRFLRHAPDAGLRAALDAFRPDALFIPLERYVACGGLPVVTVLHNMAPLAGAGTGSGLMSRLKSAAQAYEARLAVRRSAAVIAPTAFVGDFLAERLGAPREKISVINFGPSSLPAPRRPAALGAGDRFIFTVGTMELYRGLEDLAEALPEARSKFPGLKLVVAGGARPATLSYQERLKSRAGRLGVAGDILWLDGMPQDELAWCYANCAVFVMTSRLESFGFPALEAMQYGCQCVSSSAPCLPEMFGGAALYYAPGDHAGLAGNILAVLSRDGGERGRYAAAARARAAGFSWETAAARTLAVIAKAAGRPGPAAD